MSGLPSDAPGLVTIQGRAIAPGRACGPLRRNRAELEPVDFSGCVLLAERASPDDIGRILASAATLTLSGAVLSHVSLLSREFGKPSISLEDGTHARLAGENESGALILRNAGGSTDEAVLEEGDVVLLDGTRGVVTVPGGFDPAARAAIRKLHAPLAAFGRFPEDESLLRNLLQVTADHTEVGFLLEAALVYRLIPAGPPARRLLAALRTSPRQDAVDAEVALLRERVLEHAAARCDEAAHALDGAEDLEDLQRGLRGLETALDADLKLIEDLGGDPDRLEQRLEPVLTAAARRRANLEGELRRHVKDALAYSDAELRSRLGGLFRLLRRARAAQLDPDDVGRLHRRLARQLAQERARAGTHLVVPIDSGATHDRSLIGGKAAALFEAARAVPSGCRIPRGFVVTSAAYSLHLLGETGEKLRLAADQPDQKSISRKARAAILAGEIPDEVRDAVQAAFDTLPATRFAVRSSATIEDGPLSSLAGLFDSYLGVAGFDDLLHRVRWAWASLWNARALAALATLELSPSRARQAVIVQELVEVRSAGVLLSRDPDGRSDTLLINATWGLGEGISQGELAGDLYWVRRSTGELLASETGRSTTRLALAPAGLGTVEVPLAPELRGQPCLTPSELARLAELARTLEDVTGRAQDVEFGFDAEGGLVVFQMRRIVPRRSS